jgi:hypothetical protein
LPPHDSRGRNPRECLQDDFDRARQSIVADARIVWSGTRAALPNGMTGPIGVAKTDAWTSTYAP